MPQLTVVTDDTSNIPAVDGRRRRFAAPVPPDRDSHSLAKCAIVTDRVTRIYDLDECPACSPAGYRPLHRADVTAVTEVTC